MNSDYLALKKILEENELCKKIGISISHYKSGEDFLASFNSEKYQLIFLDIILQDTLDGMDIAREIRKKSKALPIVFTTGEKSYALEGYEVQPLDYLLKPYSQERVNSCIERVYSSGAIKAYLTLQIGRKNMRFPLDDIMWASSNKHAVEVVLSNDEILRSYINFEDFFSMLPKNSSFVCSSRGVAVNLHYVDFIDGSDFVLINGERLPISRSKKTEMQNSFYEYQINATRGTML